jgi:hypothetical protein
MLIKWILKKLVVKTEVTRTGSRLDQMVGLYNRVHRSSATANPRQILSRGVKRDLRS